MFPLLRLQKVARFSCSTVCVCVHNVNWYWHRATSVVCRLGSVATERKSMSVRLAHWEKVSKELQANPTVWFSRALIRVAREHMSCFFAALS
eukprot:3926414-Amphidinium_carterae.1